MYSFTAYESINGISNRNIILTRGREAAYGRSMVAYLARTISGFRVTEVSKDFQRSPMRMSHAIIQVENELHEDDNLGKTIEELKEEIPYYDCLTSNSIPV